MQIPMIASKTHASSFLMKQMVYVVGGNHFLFHPYEKKKGEVRMGLDMYLYSYKEEEKRGFKDREIWLQWRKANAIHWWFVSEIQGGVDEQGEYPVPREKLIELMELCASARDSHGLESSKFMPTYPGPFFGSIDYGNHYYWELRNTADQLKDFLNSKESRAINFYYQASW